MTKQKICIIGDGLSGLVSALTINQLHSVEVNLIAKKAPKNVDRRTTAISDSNLKFLRDSIPGLNKKSFWSSKNIELFYETEKERINFLNLKEKDTNLMHVFENDKIKKILLKEALKKKIKIIRKTITNFNEFKNYDLTILCLGGNSKIYNRIIRHRSIYKNYKEVAITGYIKHKIKNLNTSQFFLKQGPLAILPFSKDSFSFVWSVNKGFYESNKINLRKIIANKILEILKTKKKISISNIQSYPIVLGLRKHYYSKNILILGEGLHVIHPVAGQGFNLVLRDIKKLKEILKYYSNLGISFKNSYALNDFYNSRKPENIIMSLGIDATHNFFKRSKYFDPIKGVILKNIGNNESLKKISKIISNKGLSF